MHNNLKRIISGIISLAMTAVSAAAPTAASITPMQASAVQVLGESTFDNKVLPWHVFERSPARQDIEIEDGTIHITIRDPEGEEHERWDLQFIHRNLTFRAGHEYKVSFKVKGNREGFELSSCIRNLGDTEEYFVLDNTTKDMHMGPHMDGQWALGALKLTTEWQTIEGIFTPTKDLEDVQWSFEYARGIKYQGNAKQGDEIWFDDMSIECLTCGESPAEAVCGYNSTCEYGIITPRSSVRLNQLGYYPNAAKKATYASDEEKEAMDFKVLDEEGKTVYTGKTEPLGFDKAAGEYCQIIDFSAVKKAGAYTIVVDDEKNVFTNNTTHEVYKRYISPEFRIGDDVYDGILGNALNYFYQNRSGSDIEEKYITSGDKAKLAHEDINKADIAYVQNHWWRSYDNYRSLKDDVSLDVSGGWYDPEDYAKSVPDGGSALWLLQNMYERSKLNGTDGKWADGKTMTIPDEYKLSGGKSISCKDTPDILDEARYELEFMFRMIVDPEKDSIWGEKYGDFVYDSVVEESELPTPYVPLDYIGTYYYIGEKGRVINPPTFVATFNMIACAAQAARLWKGVDDDFAKECLDHARKSWDAVMKYKDKLHDERSSYYDDPLYSPLWYLNYDNEDVTDDAYWAACELYATTGDEAYYDYLKTYKAEKTYHQNTALGVPNHVEMFETDGALASFDRYNKCGCGTLSLLLSDKTSDEDKAEIKKSLISSADSFLDIANDTKNNPMGVTYEYVGWKDSFSIDYYYYHGYDYGSNSRIINNAMIMAYAYDATGDGKYLNGALQTMDYIFGRNGLGFSYVTGCGSHHVNNPVSEYWVNELDKRFPNAPDGVVVGGACSGLYDQYVRLAGMKATKEPPQKSYADSVEAWSVNASALDWQAALAWDMAFFEEAGSKAVEITTTTTTTAATTTTTTTTTGTGSSTASTTLTTAIMSEPLDYGDVNCDGGVDMGDVVLIMQALANPNKYGVGGTDKNAVRVQGWTNADVFEKGAGVTTNDALAIQEFLLGKVKSLPVS